MTPASGRRVLLGLSGDDDMRRTIEAAASFASAVKFELHCLLVEQQDLINFAGLPFARAFGRGGIASPLTLAGIEQHFNRLARLAEQALVECCARANITWQLDRPQGATLELLSTVLEEGDIVVLTLRDIRQSGHSLLQAARLLLDRAAAIVVPAPAAISGPVVALQDGPGTQQAAAIAQDIGRATGTSVLVMDAWHFMNSSAPASVIVAPVKIMDSIGEANFLRHVALKKATAALVSE